MVARVLRIQITGMVSPPDAKRPVARGDYVATQVPPRKRAADLRAEPMPRWRLRKLDAQGKPQPSGPDFILTFRDLADYIEARRMRVVEGDFF
ncbi:MAG: hypothetical protein KIT36_17710 [Alphaproteobacteria bacterium]|nr:hypothetical protein [Alphaproteobacteria bacterium]